MKRACALIALLLLPTLVLAQAETTGRVSGRVTDEDGNPVAGAKITLVSPALQGERAVTTDSNGNYTASLLPPGAYSLSVVAPNMKPVDVSFRISIGQSFPLPITLTKGEGIVEQITVYGDLTKLETTAGGENFDYDTMVNELPIVNRDIERVAELAPNISFGPTANTLSISGAPSFDTVVFLDGAEISDPYFGSAPQLWVEDAIEEVQVLTSGIGARYGRFQGGVVNATTKSGGNTFDGSARIDLNKESWNSKTPFSGETQSDRLNKVFSASLGGPIVKDRLWFFVGGRTRPTTSTTNSTALSGIQFVTPSDEDRWQVKLTGNVTPDHVIEASFLKFDATTSNRAGLPAGDLRAATGVREDPRETTTLEYQGVLSDQLFLNVQGTMKRVSILSGPADPGLGSPFLDFYSFPQNLQVWHNHWWDFSDPGDRDNDTISANLTQVLSTGNWGDHTLEYGLQYVNSKTAGENRQTATGFNLLNYDNVVSGNPFSNVAQTGFDPDNPLFNLISYADGGVTYRWEALPLGGGQDLENTALYVQDTWEKGRWKVDAGLRYEMYEGRGPEPTLDLDFKELAPRLGVTHTLDNNWQLQATWGKYISRFNDAIASSVSGVGGAPYIVTLYTGPTTCTDPLMPHCLDYDDVEAIIQDDANWGIVTTVTDPTQPTRFLASNAHAPYAIELTLTAKRGLPRDTGTVTVGYTNREYKDLLDDFTGDFGVTTVTDPGGSGATFDLDTTIWDNAGNARRQYDALTATIDYAPSARWNLGGNWTYAKTRGNYEGEQANQPAMGSIIGDFPRSIPQADAVPFGYTDDDIRHRIRSWGNYRFDFSRAGNLTLGAIGTYQSPRNYSLSAGRTVTPDPFYLTEVGTQYTHFFGGRGTERFNGWWRLDMSGRYQIGIWKDANFFVKLDILNVTDNDELIQHSTSGTSELNAAGVRVWAPTGRPDDFNPNLQGPDLAYDPLNADHVAGPGRFDCLDNPSEACTGFGRIRNQFDYQIARQFFIAAGIQW